MRKLKDSGVEWIGHVPEHWKIFRMKNCISERDAGAWGEEPQNNSDDYICIRIADFDYDRMTIKHNKNYEFTKRNYKPDTVNRLLLQKKDILIEKSGGGEKTPVGRTIIFNEDFEALYANFMERIRVTEIVLPEFMQYIFVTFYKNRYTINYIKQTTGIQNLDITAMLSAENVFLPSINEQRKIVDFLDMKVGEIDKAIDDTKATIDDYKKYKQAIITEIVTKGIGNDKFKNISLEHIGTIPEHWSVKKIKYVLSESGERTETGTEEPLSMSQKFGLIPTKDMDMIPNMASSFANCKMVHINDLVFNKLKAHLGVFAKSNYEGIVSPDYAVYQSNNNDNMLYVQFLFKTPQYISQFIKYSKGVAQGLTRLYTEELFNIFVAMPPRDEQDRITDYLSERIAEMDNLIASKESLVAELEAYKKSVIYEYVTGKKEVR